MKKTKEKRTVSWIFIAFCILVISFVFIGFVRMSGAENDDKKADGCTSFNDEWTNDFGATIDVTALDFSESKEPVTFYARVPSENKGRQLIIESRYVGFSLYLNNRLVFDYCCKDKEFDKINDVPAPLLKVIDLSEAETGDTLKIVIEPYDYIIKSEICGISIGTSDAVSNLYHSKTALDFVLGGVLVFSGITLILMHLAFRRMLKKTHGLLYLAGFSICYGVSTLFSNQLFNSFTNAYNSNWRFSLGILAFATIPLILYLIESTESPRLERLQKVYAIISTIAILTVSVLDVIPFKTMAIIYFVLIAVTLLLLICVSLLNLYVDAKLRAHNLLFLLGVVVMNILTVSELIFHTNLGFEVSVIASIVFVAVISAVNIRELLGIFEYGMKAKLIDKLAYTDGLTGVGNTTAFRERLDYLEVTKVNYDLIGIIQFDVNNLKTVNDTLGHSFGDDLIIRGANIIKKTFGSFGDVYRVGGDEFAVITTNPKGASLCETAAVRFENEIAEVNEKNDLKYDIQIAYGIAFYRNDLASKELFLRDIQKQADVLMYTMKKKMKEEKNTAVRQQAEGAASDKTVTF